MRDDYGFVLGLMSIPALIIWVGYIYEVLKEIVLLLKYKFVGQVYKCNFSIFKLFTSFNTQKDKRIFLMVFLLSTISLIIVQVPHTSLGTTTINSLFEKNEYVEEYYVLLYPNEENDINYKVRAKIKATILTYDDYDGNTEQQRVYYIREVYMNKDEIITFYDGEGIYDGLELNKRIYVESDDGREWEIELTNQKVK